MADSCRVPPAHATSLDGAILLLDALRSSLSTVDVDGCEPEELERLMRSVRAGQQALDRMAMQIGVAAARLADAGTGRGAHGVLLGDGQSIHGRNARREVDRARIAAEFDAVRAAVDDGSIGAAHVDLFARSARDLGPDLQQHLNDPDLVAAASAEPVDVFARRIRRTVDLIRGDDGLADSQSKRDASSWKSWIDERTGMGHVHGKFDPERFEAICGAVERQVSRLANEGGVTKSRGLAAQAAFGLLTGSTSTSAGSAAPHIGVLVDWETFTRGAHPDSVRETAAGRPVPPQTIARLACDAVVQRIVLDERGVPINVGRRHRTATAAQWIAIRAVYRTCAWHGCERPRVRRCLPKANSRRTPKASHLHHVHEWEHGGETDLCNLIPLCGEHHHAVHEGGWSLHLHDDRRLDIYMPDGRHHATTDPDRCPDMMEPLEPLSRSPVAANRSRRMVAAVRGGGEGVITALATHRDRRNVG